MTAALTGKVDAVKMLLAHGAKVNDAEPCKGQTALMWAASEGNAAAAEMLIEFGAEVKAKSKAGFTALLFAVRNGHIDAVEVLLAHGANVNDVAPDGTSALNMAVVNAYFELAAVLLDHGADPNAPDPRGSALHTLAWLRKPGSDGGNGLGNTVDRAAAADGQHDRARAGEDAARARRESERADPDGRRRSSTRKAARCGIRRSSSWGGIT